MKNINAILAFLILILFSPSVTDAGWLIFHKPAFKGKVIDAETKEPIEGAVVVAIYKKYPIISGPGGGSASIINVKETLTDNNGEFHIPSYTTVIQPLAHTDFTQFIIYKPGYGSYPGRDIFPLTYTNAEEFFSKDFGVKREIKRFNNYASVTFGVIELPKLKTWEERWKANMITVGGDISKSKWPLLNELINKEDEWLERHKGWRIESK